MIDVENPHVTPELLQLWAESIPVFDGANPAKPEWQPTPVHRLDLSGIGYGEVLVKDESWRGSNPTGTHKDRAAWEMVTMYRDFARTLLLRSSELSLSRSAIEQIPIPQFSVITSGNEGAALAHAFQEYKLPKPRFLVDSGISPELDSVMSGWYARIYKTDLSAKQLSPEDIRRLTDNEGGIDITSVRALERHAILYDWHVHEVFNLSPDFVFLPYGSGRLFENYLTWQYRTIRDRHEADPRLQVDPKTVVSISVLGGVPKTHSMADKLSAHHLPFAHYQSSDIATFRALQVTGEDTGIYDLAENYIQRAYDVLTDHNIAAEYSGAASLGLYLQQCDQSATNQLTNKKVVVVNSGRGIFARD